jgi:glycosyltransferase involved in cell wall biosynthesis
MANQENNLKLCFSIPKLESDAHSHHYHIYELLEKIGKHIKVFVVVDEPTRNRYLLNNVERIYFTKFKLFPLRKREQFFVFFYARFKGYRNFYSHYSLWNALLTSLITKLFGGTTFIWSCHVYQRTRLNGVDSLGKLKEWFIGVVQIFTFKIVDHIVTGTQSIASEYINEFNAPKKKFIILPNWVNLDRFHNKNSELGKEAGRSLVVIFIHSLTEEKGAMHLPTIVKRVLEEVKHVSFIIIGDGIYREFIEKEIEKYSLLDRVKILGYLPNKEVPRYLSSADLLILPSKNEGFPRVLIESMAMGVPFVTTNVGGIMDIVIPPQTEYIVQNGDIEGFSQKVIVLLKNDAMRERLSKVGLERVKKYTIEKAVGRFEKIFLLNGRDHRNN